MPSRTYLLSLPERVIRSALAFSAGLLREIGEVVVPRAVRRGQLYRSLVDVTLRYVIERVGGAKGVYPAEAPQAEDFLARRGAGHAIELLGIAALRISPVWVFAALADLTGLGRRLIPEIAEALKEQGLLEKEAQFENVDALPDRARWLSSSTRVAAKRTGKLLSAALLDEYSHTLNELREVGYATHARRQLSPYLRACVDQFSRHQRTLTERLIERIR